MAFLSLVLLCLGCLAVDVVELEPVTATGDPTDLFNCSRYDGLQTQCVASPYCLYLGAKCVDDPCLKYMTAEGDECDGVTRPLNIGSGYTVTCGKEAINDKYVTGTDCTGNAGSGFLCRATASSSTNPPFAHDYCAYAFLRDNKACPVSICREVNPTTSDTLKNQCIKNTKASCSILSTETECGLVPKCYWASDSMGCIADQCFIKGADCATYKGRDGSVPEGDCTEYKPLSSTGEVQLYCVNKKNKNPNICYLAGNNISTVDDDRRTSSGSTTTAGTYPTYFFWTQSGTIRSYSPECSTPITGCEGAGTCETIFNTKGALAGAYCTDGKHGDAGGTSILSVPSLLVFLLMLVSMFF